MGLTRFRKRKIVQFLLWGLLVFLFLSHKVAWAGQSFAASPSAVQGKITDTSGHPVAGAQISLIGTHLSIQILTNADGTFAFPPISLTSADQIITATVEASGYGRYTLQNAVLYAGQTLLLNTVQLTQNDQTLDAGGLPTAHQPPASLNQNLAAPAGSPPSRPLYFSNDVMPSTIRVAITGYADCGYYSNGQYILYPVIRVDTLSFSDYVKGVLPHEWIASWNAASLEAGAMAIKMYGWYRVNIGPRGTWNGQPYDVRADTCDQVYTGTTYASTNAAVDATFSDIMRRNAQVIQIHYVDGIVATCAGTFPGLPCMEQWGSKDLGDQGWDWQSILHYYYDPVDITGNITGGYTTPEDGATVGNSAYLAGTATADTGVAQVRFTAFWNGIWHVLGYDTAAPYEYHWDLCATGTPNGSVNLGFDIFDTEGNSALSPQGTRSITVNADCTQPRGGITSPLPGSHVTRTVALGAWAAASAGVQEVRFLVSWTGRTPFMIAADSAAPYAYGWDMCASDVPDGAITIAIEILDKSGQIAESPTGERTITKAYACPHTNAPPRNVFVTTTPTLTWERVTGAVRYELQVAGNTLFNSLDYSDTAIPAGTLSETISPPTPLENGLYYWRVRACTSTTTCGAWSAPDTFTIDAP